MLGFKNLPAKERDRYEQMAKDIKANKRSNPDNTTRRDNVGNIIAVRCISRSYEH